MEAFENQTGQLPPQFLLQQRYIIVDQAGRGGMGAVYQGIDTRAGSRRVAIKELSQSHLDTTRLAEAIAQFQQEAHLLHSLSHPNLPAVYDAFEERGRSYLVMDFIDGKTLLQLLREGNNRPLPVAHVLSYAYQLCSVLDYLHKRGIIFRDIKPANIMVKADGHLFLIDFGIARLFKEGQQQDTVFLGSPGYAPPEQHGSSQTNPRSDLYGLGATLHCLLTGRDPYYVAERFSFPPVRQSNPQVPLELDQLIQRLVEVDEQKRPASALEVQQVLARIRQQAAEQTSGLAPSGAPSAPMPSPSVPPTSAASSSGATYYPLPMPAPAAANNSSGSGQPPIAPAPIGPTVPVSRLVPPVNAGQMPLPQIPILPSYTPGNASAALWTRPFLIRLALLLVITAGGSLLAFNFIPDSFHSSHFVEVGLSLILLIIAIVPTAALHRRLPQSILLITGLIALLAGLAFAGQAALSVGQQVLAPDTLSLIVTASLAALAVMGLFWLTRPSAIITRIALLLTFGVAIVCVIVQAFFRDETLLPGGSDPTEAVTKHVFLVLALVALLAGVLIAAQMERVRGTRGR